MQKNIKELCDLVKEINTIVEKNDEERLKQQSLQLNVLISKHFENGNGSIIDDAIASIYKDGNQLSKEIIEEEVDFEIENLLFEENGKEYDSSMFLTPCIIITKDDTTVIPSINDFEKNIRNSLINKGLISNISQFQLGTVRLTPEDIEFMSSQDWWNIHRDIVDEADYNEEEKKENDEIRNSYFENETDSFVSLFYLVTTITNEDSNGEICENIYESQFDADFWAGITHEMSNDRVKFTILPPLPIKESIENAKVITEMVNFELFFEVGSSENIEIAYAKTNIDGQYIVLFFDEETKFLERFYLYDTFGDSEHFVCNLIALCMEHGNKNLYNIEDIVENDTVNKWRDIKDIVDINYLFKKANKIDLEESSRFCSFENEQAIKPTIH